MLKRLFIKNYILIDQLEIFPAQGFNVITGQTGAGKSIVLGAIGLLMGERAESKTASTDKCIIEGDFETQGLEEILAEHELDPQPVLTLRREIAPQGKSRAFINDTPVTLEVLRKVASQLVDIHSQYDTVRLGSAAYQLSILDAIAQNQTQLSQYKAAFAAYGKCQKDLNELKTTYNQLSAQQDLYRAFAAEIDKLKPEAWDLEQSEKELLRLENAESIKSRLYQTANLLEGDTGSILSQIKTAAQLMSQIAGYSPLFAEFSQRLETVRIELADIAYEINRQNDRLSYDPQKIALLRERIDTTYALLQKHRLESIKELISFREKLKESIRRVENFSEEIAEAEKELSLAEKRLREAATTLSESRKKVVGKFCEQLQEILSSLGMPQARLEVKMTEIPPQSSGTDAVVFLFSANKGHALEELGKAASGGEFSRLMLAIKYILASQIELPTVIFDEIDTGVSGEITVKVATMIREMSRRHQVFVITHQPLMAAGADSHYVVYKEDTPERTISRIRLLDEEERLEELAQMIAGANPPPSARQSAREMMSAAQ